MLGREQHGPGKIEPLALGLRHLDRELLILGLAGVAVDVLDAAVDLGGDLETVVVAVAGLEGRRAHVRDAGAPFLRLQFGDLAEVLHIAFAGGAGEIEGDASARLGGRLGAGGVEQLQFIDGPVRRQSGRGFGARGARSERAGRERKSRENESRASRSGGAVRSIWGLLDFKAAGRLRGLSPWRPFAWDDARRCVAARMNLGSRGHGRKSNVWEGDLTMTDASPRFAARAA